MKTLLIATGKGGSGKTTLARNIAALAAQEGLDVALIDTDAQRTLSKWWANRQKVEGAPPISLYQADLHQVGDAISDLAHDLVIIDTPPVVDAGMASTVKACDYVLIPCRPSPDDWESVLQVHELAAAAGTPVGYVINAAVKRASLNDACRLILVKRGAPLCPVLITHRQDFVLAAIEGLGVTEIKNMAAAADEIRVVAAFIRQQLGMPQTEAAA